MDINTILGNKYGKLTITGIAPTPSHIKNPKTLYVYCDCDCGNTNVVKRFENLKSNLTRSCGCEYHKTGVRYKHNNYIIKDNYAILYDSKNREFYVSLTDLPKVLELTWYVNEARDNEVINGCNKIKLHRYIMDVTDSNIDIDHINHDRRDNRRENLRIATRSENNRNRYIHHNTSGKVGVSYSKARDSYESYIGINGKCIKLGYSKSFEEAVAKRIKAEEKYYGDWTLNKSLKLVPKINE